VNLAKPRIIEFSSFGDPSTGILTVAALERDIPYAVRRVFWTYGTPSDVIRGHHAHHRTETVLVAISGTIVVSTELPDGECEEFTLDSPKLGLYLPPLCWRTMRYMDSAVQVAIESTDYSEDDYIRRLDDFRTMTAPLARGTY
jgi:hypothetical protein